MQHSRDQVLIVSNPSAGSGRRGALLHQLCTCLTQLGLEPELVTEIARLPDIVANSLAATRLRGVIAAGGDGTVAEVVNRVPWGVPVTVFPLGTANLLAHYLQIRRDPSMMAQIVHDGFTVRLDAAQANGRIFLLMAGCGFDADVVRRLHDRRSGRFISYWTWIRPLWDAIRRYRFAALRVYCQRDAASAPQLIDAVHWAFVVNLPAYAGGLSFAPEAVGTDGLLDVCTFAKGSIWHGLQYAGNVAASRHERLADFRSAVAARVRIEADEPVPYQLDGDPGGLLPLEIEVLPNRLTLLAPRSRARELGLQGIGVGA